MNSFVAHLAVIRYPLSKTPATDFLNRAKAKP
jgi:hypothetical protein